MHFFHFQPLEMEKMHFLDQYVVMIITCELYNLHIIILDHVSHAFFYFHPLEIKKCISSQPFIFTKIPVFL